MSTVRTKHLKHLRGKKIFVGLSGGVDSAVTAALLQKAGAHITGVFIKGWYPPGMPCTWSEDRREAMRVAAHLRIPFVTLDASDEYKRGVIDYLLSEYKAGRTPNPDIMCNKEVKFGAFHTFAKEQGAQYIATGHYARTERDADGRARLLRGIDPNKDQSYFLWAIPKRALADTLFPLGSFHKSEVRSMAEAFGLPNATKRDSQGICFLGNVSVEEFLTQEFGSTPGHAFDEKGTEVGIHAGALLSTLGQRIALQNASPGPWYVIGKDMTQNTVTVAHQPRSERTTVLSVRDANWFTEPENEKQYSAQYRYHGPRVPGTFDDARQCFVPTDNLCDAIASGQSLVLYEDEECIGGGIIA